MNELLIGITGSVIATILVVLSIKTYGLAKKLYQKNSAEGIHLGFYHDRNRFNQLGVDILNGSDQSDSIYLVLRTGIFYKEFLDSIETFKKKESTTLTVIVPKMEVFEANHANIFSTLIDEIYENPKCDGVRGLVLEPGVVNPEPERLAGYLFVSDSHNHKKDDGIYGNSIRARKFLLGYVESLKLTGTKMEMDRKNMRSK